MYASSPLINDMVNLCHIQKVTSLTRTPHTPPALCWHRLYLSHGLEIPIHCPRGFHSLTSIVLASFRSELWLSSLPWPQAPRYLRRSILKDNLTKWTSQCFNDSLWLSCSKPFWAWVPYLACQGPNFPSAMVCFTHLSFSCLRAPKLRAPDWKE